MNTVKHSWSFSSIGGVKRVNLDTAEDLLHLETLDQKLWTALSCPTKGLETDEKTLEMLDRDKDGQIRVPEILAAVKWMCSILKSPGDLLKQSAEFPLSALNTANEEAAYLLHCSHIILKNLGKPDAQVLTAADTSDFTKIFSATDFNGDGVITEDSSHDDALKAVIGDIKKAIGAVPDRSGKEGLDTHLVQTFFEKASSWLQWQEGKQEAEKALGTAEDAAKVYAAWLAVKEKIDDYFLRCKLAAFDAEGAAALNQLKAKMEALATADLLQNMDEIKGFPLARIEAAKPLPLNAGINPGWELAIQQFAALACQGLTSLSERAWEELSARMQAYGNWLQSKPAGELDVLGEERIRDIIGSNQQEALLTLIAKDLELADEADSILMVDRMVRYYRDLYAILKNFVTFFDFYTAGKKAVFQAGTLYIDQRSCDLCIKVSDMGRHDMMAALSGMYLLYCKCVSRAGGEDMIIAAALTNGDIDNMIVGRNAVFYDRNGMDWDATVIKIIENPISVRQAFWTPYRTVSRFIEKQINKFASDQDSKVTKEATGAIEAKGAAAEATVNKIVVKQEPATPETPFDIGKFVGIFAAIGLALGAIGTAIASIVAGFIALSWWKMPLAIMGIMLIISGPSMIMAYLKLRKRNLAPLLDANGWAINARVTVNIKFGNALTQIAALPLNARVNLNDPFRQKGIPAWKLGLYIAFAVIIVLYAALYFGYIHLP